MAIQLRAHVKVPAGYKFAGRRAIVVEIDAEFDRVALEYQGFTGTPGGMSSMNRQIVWVKPSDLVGAA